MSVLDARAILRQQAGKTLYDEAKLTWFADHIPILDTPDDQMNEVYYYRWRLFENTIRRNASGRYEITEGAPGENYHSVINAPSGHHIYEGRWLRNSEYIADYIEVLRECVFPGYANWQADAIYAKYLADGDADFAIRQLPWLQKAYYERWERETYRHYGREGGYDEERELFYWISDREGMEATVAGFDELERSCVYRASFTAPGSTLDAVRDNETGADRGQRGESDAVASWSSAGSGKKQDWIEVDFPRPVRLIGIRLWLLANKNHRLPDSVQVYVWREGRWREAGYDDEFPLLAQDGHAPDAGVYPFNIAISEASTSRVRVLFKNRDEGGTGVTELIPEVFGEGEDWENVVFGRSAYRPSLNSYMAGNSLAIAKLASLAGDAETEAAYRQRGIRLQRAIVRELWDEAAEFFVQRTRPAFSVAYARELVGYIPWYFRLVPDERKYARAWDQLGDDRGFQASMGLTTLERRNPHYMQPFNHACLWNGPVWPFAVSQTLTAMANMLHDYKRHDLTPAHYREQLASYTALHYDTGSRSALMARENHHPDERRWLAPAANYHHSTYADLVITGLAGLRPRADGALDVRPLLPPEWHYFALQDIPYRGRSITLVFDRDGTNYRMGKGWMIFCDGERMVHSERVESDRIFLTFRNG
ncbi:glycosyl hydrolase family 65 protein [Paenibacillaceae bacterium WGS1546]|uniref:MGH1-like glycoside hydrolase domain-containing protein n=1 Tax=Cohnella sp. WGS1546 TaxID=3366810 RepID=UPI00372D0FDD